MTLLDKLAQIDGNLLIGIQHSLNADWLTSIMKCITFFGEVGWASILLCLVLMTIKKTRRLGFVCAGTVLLTFVISTFVIKPIVVRTRPWVIWPEVNRLIAYPGDSSFPSGHSSNCMSVAFALWLNTRPGKKGVKPEWYNLHRWSYVAIVMALLVGLSRLYLGVHFPSDVIGGFLIAILCAEIIYMINVKIESRNVIINKRYNY